MSHSLNEIEAMSKKAARGAGLSWGMSEEAARSVRWLASHDLPGVALLADVLTRNDNIRHAEIAPVSLEGVWKAPSGTLCPLIVGAALNDCADRLTTGRAIEMEKTSCPLLVVPFAAWASIHIGAPVTVSWLNARIETDGYRIWIDDPDGDIDVKEVASLTCAQATPSNNQTSAPALRGTVDPSAWERLGVFAHRTYAPATSESRLLGAGAGETDND